MATIIVQLDPTLLENPDLDIRYKLPDLLVERSSGLLQDVGYDYAGEPSTPCLLLLFETEAAQQAVPVIVDVLRSERVLGNNLSDVPVAIQDGEQFRVLHPPNFQGKFHHPGAT
jgi:hypothetical protein